MKTVKQIVEEASQLDEGLGSVSNPWNKAIIGAHIGLTFKDMPMVIIFQRKSIRTFPDNQMVGLYYAQGIDQYLSLPFNSETGQFFKEEAKPIRENFNDNLITLRQEGALANAASGVAKEVGRRMKDYAVDTVKSGVRKARLGLGIDKLDSRTPADNLDRTRKDYGGVGTQIYNTLDTDRRRTAAEYRQHYGSNDPEPEANVKENFCNTLYTLREQGIAVRSRKVTDTAAKKLTDKAKEAKDAFIDDWQKTKDMYNDQAAKQQDMEAKAAGSTGKPDTGENDVIPHNPDDNNLTWVAKKLANKALQTGTETIGPMMAGPNASASEKQSAAAQYAKYVGMAFASKGLESISGYRQARAERALGHVAQDKRTPAGKQNAKVEEPGKTEPKPPPTPAARVSTPAVPRPLRTPPRRSWSMKESATNLDIIKKMIKEDIKVSTLVFDEKEISISNMLAKKLFELYCSLNNENRKEMIHMLNENATSYRKLVQFSIKR